MQQKLIANNLCYSIDGKDLLHNISLELSSGSLHAILGPNGSGKSTLLKVLTGIWKLSSGRVLWNGESLLDRERQAISRIVSLVPQSATPSFDFLVEDIVAMGRYPYDTHYWKATDTSLLEQALNAVDAIHLRRRRINHLSHGERQRIFIARALVTESPILLLDEPTACLDIRHQLEIWKLLQNFVKNGKIVAVTTHDLTIAERYCDQVAVLNHGHCVGKGAFETLMTQKLLQEVFAVAETTLPQVKYYTSI